MVAVHLSFSGLVEAGARADPRAVSLPRQVTVSGTRLPAVQADCFIVLLLSRGEGCAPLLAGDG